MSGRARLEEVLGAAELGWLLERMRRRLEKGEALRGTVSLREPTAAQREAVGRLFGTPGGRGDSLSVNLERLESLLVGAGLCSNLREAVEALVGPVEDRRARREQEAEEWARLFARLGERAAAIPAAPRWLEELRASGLLKRLAAGEVERAEALATRALEVAARLPAGHVPIAELAAAVAGDAHALDPGEPLGTLALRLVARALGIQAGDDAESRRELWAAAGVLCDELSAPVLVLNLRAEGETLTARSLRMYAEAGEPCRVSARQLHREPLRLAELGVVFVCENPSVVVAAANALGAKCAPLVCTEGMPRNTALKLLGQLAAAGALLRYHGDFDWPGLRIANLVIERFFAWPWRMSARDYESAAAGGSELRGEPVAARWDAKLEPAMRRQGRAVHEEQVLGELLADLAGD